MSDLKASWIRCAAVFGALLSLAAPARAAIMLDGVPSSEYEAFAHDAIFQSVGWVSGWDSSGRYVAGSGVLIAPDWILTAGHVITQIDDSGWTSMGFSLTSSIYGEPLNITMADGWYAYPGYSGTALPGSNSDIGLIHLSQPIVDIAPAVLFSGEDQRNTLMYMAGYGQPGTFSTGLQPFDGLKRAGSNVAEAFGGDGPNVFAESQYWISSFSPTGSDLQPLEWQTSPGDSGGGWFAIIDGTTYLVGIDHGYYGVYGMGDSMAIRTSLYDDWIYGTMTSVPEPATWALFFAAALTAGPCHFLRRRKRLAA